MLKLGRGNQRNVMWMNKLKYVQGQLKTMVLGKKEIPSSSFRKVTFIPNQKKKKKFIIAYWELTVYKK